MVIKKLQCVLKGILISPALWGLVLLSGCQQLTVAPEFDPKIIKPEQKRFVAKEQLIAATPEEINEAHAGELVLKDGHADSPSGQLRLMFDLGKRIEFGAGMYTTTSTYSLTERRTGRVLATVVSTLSASDPEIPNQRFYLSRDERMLLIYEERYDGTGPRDSTSVLCVDPISGAWTTRFIGLPAFNRPREPIPRNAIPAGISGEWILFDPLVGDKIYKKPLKRFRHLGSPVPFGVG